jgi:hypothetical protein
MTPRTLRKHHRAAQELIELLEPRTGRACTLLAPLVLLGLDGWCITPRKVTSPTPAELRALWAEACAQADVHGLPPALAHRGHRRAWFVRWSVARPGQWGDFGLTVAGSLDAWLCGAGVEASS